MDTINPTRQALKSVIKKSFRTFGFDIRSAESLPKHPVLPPLYHDPLEALHNEIGMRDAAFHCPIAQCVSPHGFSFSEQGWHPLSDTLAELHQGVCTTYAGSTLERYFTQWQPRNLAEALPCLNQAPENFSQLPSYLLVLHPWVALSPQQILNYIRQWCQDDYAEHGRPDFQFDSHGFHFHGPVHPELGELEFTRLRHVYESISEQGFFRESGDFRVWMLKRGNDIRFMRAGSGTHRLAALHALGHTTFPARLVRPKIIDIDEVEHWPQVRSGIWDRITAQHYFNQLFDFNSLTWARRMAIQH